jgi:hypothetical protein
VSVYQTSDRDLDIHVEGGSVDIRDSDGVLVMSITEDDVCLAREATLPSDVVFQAIGIAKVYVNPRSGV